MHSYHNESVRILCAMRNNKRIERKTRTKLESVVGAIDGTSTEIYRPQIELQELLLSGHRHFHAIHTQIVIDNTGYFCYTEAEFLGHQNDTQFTTTKQNAVNGPLHFPEDCVLVVNKIYPNRHPIVTPFTTKTRTPEHMKRKCRTFNRLVSQLLLTKNSG